MKKILLASTALVGFAGAAAAEVSLSGYAEIGIKGGTGMQSQFHNDIDVTFNLTGESDSGLSFGATIDLDEVTSSAEVGGAGSFNKSSVWVKGSFGKVTLGDTDGAADWAVSEIYLGTALTDDHSTHAGAYWGTGLDGIYDGQVMRYEYSFGSFGVAVSAEIDDTLDTADSTATAYNDTTAYGDANLGIGVKWSGDMGGTSVNAGLGYQSNGDSDVVELSAGASMASGVSVAIEYADGDLDKSVATADDQWWGLGVGYTANGVTAQVNYGEYDSGANGWGLVVNYDLGGGAVAMLGYGDSGGTATGNTWSAGLGLSF
ncbi:MAG: porin [Rhodobacteraceae bacterium]|nr:porin [Paracoccaceae bacterium]